MPELPEVETVKRVLEPQLAGRTITRLALAQPGIVAHPAPQEFAAAVTGAQIAGMARRGKFLSILLAGGGKIVLHLRMTGSLLLTPPGWPQEKHTHLVFYLDDGQELRYTDPRRFGRFWLFRKGEEDTLSGMHKLGPEPFDEKLTDAYLSQALGKRKRAIKDCLLDQSLVAGIGNIYADESLFEAGIAPTRPACTLTEGEWQRLAAAIPAVMARALQANALTPQEYLAAKGQEYRGAPSFQVYGRGGKACPRCGQPLHRTVVAGRSSVYCPACQA